MAILKLPFWIVTEHRHILNPPAQIPCDDPLAPHAYTSTEKLTAFLAARAGGKWDVNLVADEDAVVVAVADLHEQGAANICFDPDPDGSGGLLVSISDVLAAFGRSGTSPAGDAG